MGNNGRKMTSVFCKRGDAVEYIRPGDVFRRMRASEISETAEIVEVYTDPVGIPHISYDVTFKHASHPVTHEGLRVLTAATFFDHYGQRLEKGRRPV